MATPEQVQAAVNAYATAVTQGDKDAFLAVFAPDAVWHDPVGAPPHEGHDGIAAFWGTMHEMASDIRAEPEDVVVCGDEAAVQMRITAGNSDGAMTFVATEIFTVADDGRITLLKAYWDMTRAVPAD